VIVPGDTTLGIEITNLYLVPGQDVASEQVQARRREKVLQVAQAAFLASGGRRFELSVDFDPRNPILRVESIAQALCALAQSLVNAKSGEVSRNLFAHIKELRFVYLNALEYPDSRWRLVQGFSVPNLSIERVREVVNEKATKLKEYQPCGRYWLLAIVDFIDRAQDQEVVWPEGASLGNCPFEKVLIYKPQFRQVLEVPQ
jgi:hypothetical protein